MIEVELTLPRVLAEMTGGRRVFKSHGKTPHEVLKTLSEQNPHLRVHFFDETGAARKHIICIVGETYVRAGDLDEHQLIAGDNIQLINALAGG